jgi:hypothetical protein
MPTFAYSSQGRVVVNCACRYTKVGKFNPISYEIALARADSIAA